MLTDPKQQLPPTQRFSNRVENYAKYRPSYPPAIIPFFEMTLGLRKDQRIADIGSGTGLFAKPLLAQGYTVTCLEPNEDMRRAGERELGQHPGFTSRRHAAEHTGLRSGSVDLITVAQAFHWMDPAATKKEFQRILKPGGHTVLVWNLRRKHTPFMEGYDALKQEFAIDGYINNHVEEAAIQDFFAPAALNIETFSNPQRLDFDGLKGQLLSSSYIPLPGHPRYDAMIAALADLFVEHNQHGFVTMLYETKLYWV
jgi:SAM-dependent methyltransferase